VSWTGPNDVRAQLVRLWERGELLRDAVTASTRFPLRVVLKVPSSTDITQRFEAVRGWTADLAAATRLRLEWQQVRHRVQGMQRLPASAWIDSIEDALSWLGKRPDWERFGAVVAVTRQTQPALLPWLEKRPLQALALADVWPRLLAVVTWLMAHPRPGIYLRQVDVAGLHTKFIEAHRGVLAELLDLALPAAAVDFTKTGISQFAARYGFLDKPPRIRFRVLDPHLRLVPGSDCPDIALDAASFSRLDLGIERVFITENETNFLAFPRVPGAIVIFGAGYGWEPLASSHWLKDCALYYWGDIDTHGFAILDQLRRHFGHVCSFLMDSATLDAHTAFCGVEDQPSRADLGRLTVDEYALYDDLRKDRISKRVRLEQEHISFSWLSNRLQDLLLTSPPSVRTSCDKPCQRHLHVG
jgi:hypothetical protein